jgi:DNA-binding IclR family transcriptional regulator
MFAGRNDKQKTTAGGRARVAANDVDHARESKGKGVAAVDRALSILGAFKDNEHKLALSQIAQRTGLYKSTVLRLIDSLESFGYIRRLPSGDYQLGATLFRLGMLYRQAFNLGDYVMPALQSLSNDTNESASFYVRSEQSRLCLFRVDSQQAVRDHVRTGDQLPLRKGAAGRVLTTFEAGAGGAKGAAADKFTIVSIGERQPDLAAVAAPVFGVSGELVGAISVSGPRARFTKAAVAGIAGPVLIHARRLTELLGGDTSVYPSRPSI